MTEQQLQLDTAAGARRALAELVREGQALAHELPRAATEAARAAHEWKRCNALALRRSDGRSADLRGADALSTCAAAHEAHVVAEANLDALRLRLRWLSSAVSAAMTLVAQHRAEADLATPYGHDPDDPGPREPPA